MVSHDFTRRTITGLPDGARSALRRGASLESVGVHRSIADVWRSVAAPAGRPLPSMSAADIRRELGRGVLSDAAPADSALFGGEVRFGLVGVGGFGPTAPGDEVPEGAHRSVSTRDGGERYTGKQYQDYVEAIASSASAGCTPDEFQQAFDYYDCRSVAKYGVPFGYPNGCTRMGIPSSAWSQPCGLSEWTGWFRPGDECPEPLWSQTTAAEPFETVVAESYPGCSSSLTSFLNAAVGHLIDNIDLVNWVLCRVYGPGTTCLQAALRNLDGRLTCGELDSAAATANPTLVVVNHGHATLQFLLAQFEDGDPERRLCAVQHLSILVFHELQHLCLLGGLATVDRDCGEEPFPFCHNPGDCEPVWMASNTLKVLLRLRYPNSRKSPCCDGCLSDLFFSNSEYPWGWKSCSTSTVLVEQGW